MKTRHVLILCAVLLHAASACAQQQSRFLSRLHAHGYLELYANQQNAFDADRYISEGALEAELSLVRLTGRTHIMWRISCATAMGKAVTSGLPFSVQEVRYALVPFIEYGGDSCLVRAGLDHGCDHLVLKDTEQPWYLRDGQQMLRDVYDNRLFAGVGSATARRTSWRALNEREKGAAPAWVHYAEVGYFLQDLFGAIDAEALNEGNDWWWDLAYDLRCRLWDGNAGSLWCINRLHLLLDRDSDIYWRDRVGIEFQPARTGLGSAFALTWQAVDEHVRDSKEGLIALSGHFFF